MNKISIILILFITLGLITSCSNDNWRYYNTLEKGLTYNAIGKDLIRRDARIKAMKDIKYISDLNVPKIAYAECYQKNERIFIIIDWICLKHLEVNGFILKSQNGEVVKYTFPDLELKSNEELSAKIILFTNFIFFPPTQLPEIMRQKNIVIVLTKDGIPVSAEVPIAINLPPNDKKEDLQ